MILAMILGWCGKCAPVEDPDGYSYKQDEVIKEQPASFNEPVDEYVCVDGGQKVFCFPVESGAK